MLEKQTNQTQKLPAPSVKKALTLKIISIALASALYITILLVALNGITDEKNAKNAISKATIAILFSKGIEDETEIIALKNEMDKTGETSIQAISGLSLQITKEDIQNLSPRDIRLKILTPIVSMVYEENTSSIEKLIITNEMREKLSHLNLVMFLTEKNHETIELYLTVSILITLLLSSAVVLLNSGIKKIKNLAKIIIWAALPGLVIMIGAKYMISNPEKVTVTTSGNEVEIIGKITQAVLPDIANIAFTTYLLAFILGVFMYISARMYLLGRKLLN